MSDVKEDPRSTVSGDVILIGVGMGREQWVERLRRADYTSAEANAMLNDRNSFHWQIWDQWTLRYQCKNVEANQRMITAGVLDGTRTIERGINIPLWDLVEKGY